MGQTILLMRNPRWVLCLCLLVLGVMSPVTCDLMVARCYPEDSSSSSSSSSFSDKTVPQKAYCSCSNPPTTDGPPYRITIQCDFNNEKVTFLIYLISL